MKAIYLAPFAFLPLSAALGVGLFAQLDRADGAERRAVSWEEVARKESAALDDLMAADKRLKAATERLQAACAAR